MVCSLAVAWEQLVDPDPFCSAVIRALLWYEKYECWFPEPQAHAVGSLPWISMANQAAQRGVQPIPSRESQAPKYLGFCAHQPHPCPAECSALYHLRPSRLQETSLYRSMPDSPM